MDEAAIDASPSTQTSCAVRSVQDRAPGASGSFASLRMTEWLVHRALATRSGAALPQMGRARIHLAWPAALQTRRDPSLRSG
jgi:hypothetical protein